jgi:hypothetical protein
MRRTCGRGSTSALGFHFEGTGPSRVLGHRSYQSCQLQVSANRLIEAMHDKRSAELVVLARLLFGRSSERAGPDAPGRGEDGYGGGNRIRQAAAVRAAGRAVRGRGRGGGITRCAGVRGAVHKLGEPRHRAAGLAGGGPGWRGRPAPPRRSARACCQPRSSRWC